MYITSYNFVTTYKLYTLFENTLQYKSQDIKLKHVLNYDIITQREIKKVINK